MVIPVEPRPRQPRRGGPSGLLAMSLVVALAIGIWLLAGRDPGTTTGDPSGSTSGPAVVATAGLPVVQLGALPPEAAETLALVDDGGPFPESEDGSTFHNYEGLLPERDDGYYREYTVPTPGSDDRGARRLIVGEQGEIFWTDDHYASFSAVAR